MKRTEWFPISINPMYTGVYEVTNSPEQYPTDRETWNRFCFYTGPVPRWEDGAFTLNKINFQYWRGVEKEETSTPQMREHTLQMRLQRMRDTVEDAINMLQNQLSEDEVMKKLYP